MLARIRANFPDDAERVTGMLAGVESGRQDRERVLAAVVLIARGDLGQLQAAINLSRLDGRDVLFYSPLANEHWPEQLDRLLGPA